MSVVRKQIPLWRGWASKLGLDYDRRVFKVEDKVYASERNSLVFAAKNPLDAAHMVLTFAGLWFGKGLRGRRSKR